MENETLRTSIIPIFIPHIGCPYRCVFCNQWRITGHAGIPDASEVRHLIHTYTQGVGKRHWEAAFYGGSFTAIPASLQESLLEPAYEALQAGRIDAIRCSTRPDCITGPILRRLQRYGMTTVELGVQSMDDNVLERARRGHTAAQVIEATALLRQYGFTVGHQLMPGLPGEDWTSLSHTTDAICRLKPDITRIYPVAVIAGTELAKSWQKGEYQALTIHEGVRRAAYMKQCFLSHGIQVIRTGLQATENLDDPSQVLAGAYTPAMGEMVDTRRYQLQLFDVLDCILPGCQREDVVISYHRRDTSRVRGIRNVTVHRSRLRYGREFLWNEDDAVPMHHIRVTARTRTWLIDTDRNQISPDLPGADR